jgi:sugar/nucleoside kinase (ribokinase family)
MEVLPYTDYIFGNEDEMAAFADSQKIDSKVVIINYRI